MHKNREATLGKFEQALRTGIARKLGRQVSAQRFANQFNLRAHGTDTISRETARKWMRGATIPDYERLSVLVEWLKLDPLEFLVDANAKANRALLTEANVLLQDRSKRVEALIQIAKALDPQSQEALFIAAWALKHVSSSPARDKAN